MSPITTDTLTGKYTPDSTHSRIGFVARHAMVTKVRGQFTEYLGSGHFNAEDPTRSTFELTIQAASIDTGNTDRDGHLKSGDFFHMENHPTITFASTSIEKTGDNAYNVTGPLTVRGVTRPVTIAFTYTGTAVDPYGNTRIGLEGSTVISRKDFGMTWNTTLDAGGVLVSDKVTLEFDVSAIKSPDA